MILVFSATLYYKCPPLLLLVFVCVCLDSFSIFIHTQHPRQYTARDLVHMIVPLIRTEGEIGEVVITALGLANPAAFG